ncbi:pyruvate kinase [Longimicrobium sp.]|uniref:pyruvate kinase n=1 Tax=Longimicrobium sp. TaxID=2029185 RepID=UPI002E3528D7|nr:pyruvate kinase [Longimicrobium sp.]HEX6040430.1 pyruvate kinase [Longimicrobium sp.]
MQRRTKIVCTLGPASWSPERIDSLIQAGMDVARINFSHGDLERHAETIRNVREASTRAGRPIAVLGDLQGPKIRVGVLPEPVELKPGDRVVFAPEGEHQEGELPTTFRELAQDVEVGDVVLLADGLMELIVEEVTAPRVAMRVIHGGDLSSNKGINLPGTPVSIPSLTEKDLRDLEFALEQRVDYLALSFVRSPEDVKDLVSRIPEGGPLVVVKVEKGMALENLQEILKVSSAAMVARGDLGVELPFERVPLAQKRMIQMANLGSRPVITATQMLESMIENPRPTRAEASDVANAIIDGTDAVMLSAETATGKFPVQAVQAMARIAQEIEDSHILESGPHYDMPIDPGEDGKTPTERAIAGATVEAVRRLKAPLILTFTTSGSTARVVSSFRPPVPILAITDNQQTYQQLALVWGVIPVVCSEYANFQEMLACGRDEALKRGLAQPGDRIVVTAGLPLHQPGTTNLLQVSVI